MHQTHIEITLLIAKMYVLSKAQKRQKKIMCRAGTLIIKAFKILSYVKGNSLEITRLKRSN